MPNVDDDRFVDSLVRIFEAYPNSFEKVFCEAEKPATKGGGDSTFADSFARIIEAYPDSFEKCLGRASDIKHAANVRALDEINFHQATQAWNALEGPIHNACASPAADVDGYLAPHALDAWDRLNGGTAH